MSIDKLIQVGADVNKGTKVNKATTALKIAASKGYIGCLRLLIQAKADVNHKKTTTALYQAAWREKSCTEGTKRVCIEMLLEAGANVNDGDDQGFTPLYVACYFGYAQCVQALLNAGAMVNLHEQFGSTPLMEAS